MDHLERCHAIVLAGPVDRVFPLFTPAGETLWAEGWDPEFLHPASGDIMDGMVFRTRHHGETTLWACIDWNPESHRVRYVRVTPSSRFGFVEVVCREAPGGRTEATIAYTYTALSPQGRVHLAELSEAAFTRMIEDWRNRIDRLLAM
ncbi:SRPBCC family protein [Inquilinus sp.]|uniref:SRPBCC family protein n=1 Tax=Inquilinus sp. TaxID=1932117 RepID=UPI0031DEC3C3